MQWVRSEMTSRESVYTRLVGIRYFSCASVKASNMGVNYVFPASGRKNEKSFCPILSKAFKLTKPQYLHEFHDISLCESSLAQDRDLDYV